MQPSPATQFRSVVVTDDQTGQQWRAAHASVRDGLLVIEAHPPSGFLDGASHTYTIVARDGGERLRRFESLALAWRAQREVAFR